MNILFCSVGRRGELIKDFRKSASAGTKIVAADNSRYAPALYLADKQYLVPKIDDPTYIDRIIGICKKENIRAITTFIDPEIELLSKNRSKFTDIGVEVLAPYERTAHLCFDKYKMFCFLQEKGIPTVKTWDTLKDFTQDMNRGIASLPVFVKPRTGSGSVGARRVYSYEELRIATEADPSLIIQELMDCEDLDADVYIDTITHEAVAAFSKRKIETRIGGASKTVSFKDSALFDLICKVVSVLDFNGPVDMDFFCRDGVYYLSEINPRFGGAYLHAYGAGVDFIKLIENNVNGIVNVPNLGNYEEGIVMMMYDSVVICRADELAQ